jgi:hypothetical protein
VKTGALDSPLQWIKHDEKTKLGILLIASLAMLLAACAKQFTRQAEAAR